MKKQCKTCKKLKDRKQFHLSSYYTDKTGKQTVSVKPDCKVCANKKWKAQITERLNSLVPEWKCSKCGYNKCKAALDFHHIESKKKDFTIASRWTTSVAKLTKELQKCILLCAICHRELHAEE